MIVDAQDQVDPAEVPSSADDAADAEPTSRSTRRTWWRAGVALVGLFAYATAAQLSTNEIVVKPGDTLTKIAGDYRTSVQAIVAANDIENPNLIVAGRTLVIPSTTGDTTHVVRMGDSISRLAATYGTTADAIVTRNKLADPNLIRLGQTLVIPRAAAPAAVAPPTTAAPSTSVATPATTAAPTPSVAPPTTAAPAAVEAPTTTPVPTTTTPVPVTVSPTTTPPGTIPRLGSGGGLVSTMWVVQPGDTIASIAARFGLTPRRLASANALNESDPLLPGQRIYVPQG